MITLDAEALLRRLLDDDPEKSRKLDKLLDTRAPVLVTDVVLVEIVSLLAGQHYQAGSTDIALAIDSLLREPAFMMESREAVWAALQDFITAAETNAPSRLSDTLGLHKAKITATAYGDAFKGHYSFDAKGALNTKKG